MKMKLYEFGPTRSIRVRWTLQELEADFESIRVNLPAGEHCRPEFLKINPAGKIPVLVDGDLVLTESVAIVLYLRKNIPTGGCCRPASTSEPRSTAGCCSRRQNWSSPCGVSHAIRRSTLKNYACPTT